MRLHYFLIIFIFIPTLAFAFVPQYQLNPPTDYDFEGEELHYALYWAIFHVANAKTQVKRATYQNRPVYKFQDSVSTAGLLLIFKRIRDWAQVFWDGERNIPLFLEEHQEEGHYQKSKTYVFDHEKKQVVYTNQNLKKEEKQIAITPIMAEMFCDTHSAVYFFRKYGRFQVGETTVFPICTGKRFANVRLKVVAKEKVRTPFGKIETFKVEPSSELNVKGVFRRQGRVFVWLTTNKSHLPVMVKAKVKIGSVKAVLVEAKSKYLHWQKKK
ncbi:MAG: DUF3108 domain-containing protein [Candidatus Desulfofervidaceae bacterium]|nr:DUF3108 domain-containing protein [Candidatus Desulfofervidaceae bacterium]